MSAGWAHLEAHHNAMVAGVGTHKNIIYTYYSDCVNKEDDIVCDCTKKLCVGVFVVSLIFCGV